MDIEKLNITLPALSPSQAITLADWLFALAHELECRYGDDIRSEQQAARNQQEKCDHSDTDGKCDV
jgi:hypothetical protein